MLQNQGIPSCISARSHLLKRCTRVKLGWPLDRSTFIKRLDELRVIRNNVMHFNPEPLPANTVDRLRYILKLLRDFGGLITP